MAAEKQPSSINISFDEFCVILIFKSKCFFLSCTTENLKIVSIITYGEKHVQIRVRFVVTYTNVSLNECNKAECLLEVLNVNEKFDSSYHIGVGFAEKAVRENGNHKNVDDKRHEQGNGRFNEKVHVGLANGRLVLTVNFARLETTAKKHVQ